MLYQEYKVIILDPYPADAEKQLNVLALDRWTVVAVAHRDRVILTRKLQPRTYPNIGE